MDSTIRLAVIATGAALAARLWAVPGLGFGDAEALYAVYALHPQPAYLDHPGLVGLVARVLGGGSAPTPAIAHAFASIVAGLVPLLGALAAWATGSSASGAARTAIALALVPEIAIGLFALTPHVVLAPAWLVSLGSGALALRSDPKSFRALVATLGAFGAAGIACTASASGGLLVLALVASFCTADTRPRWRTIAPWAGLALAAILVAPIVVWEAREGAPMLRHRLVATQGAAGPSLRNLGALVGGQLAYVTPPFLYAAWLALRSLHGDRARSAVDRLLWFACLGPGLALGALCLWSRVAEPHWLAPAYLALAVHAGRAPVVGRRLGTACAVTGAAVIAVALAWVKTDWPPRLLAGAYEARFDLANDLHAWPTGGAVLRDVVGDVRLGGVEPVVVGPHWIVCAQASAALGAGVRVGCRTPIGDDFERWNPTASWWHAPVVVFVHDDRFRVDPARELTGRAVREVRRASVHRGGRVVRTFTFTVLVRDTGVAHAGALAPQAPAGGCTASPALRISSSSACSPGFGVVSRRSP